MTPPAEIHADGWARHNIWANAASVRELYAARARDSAEEMTCAAQAAELLARAFALADPAAVPT